MLRFENINLKLVELSQKTGYEITQINGQRRYGPPPYWKGPRPSKGSELFIGGLPRNLFEYDLVPLFEKYGTIYELRLMMEFSGENKGYGFVTMANPKEASLACAALNRYEVTPGRHIGVVPSWDHRRLFLGGIPKHKGKEEILRTVRDVVDGVEDIIMYTSIHNKRIGRGYVFLEFESHRAAAIGKRALSTDLGALFGSQVIVEWANSEPYVDENIMSQVKVLFMRNLLVETSSDFIKQEMIKSAGGKMCVVKVKKQKDYAFIHFQSREDAQRALDYWNGRALDGSAVETAWAKPPDKVKRFNKNSRERIPEEKNPFKVKKGPKAAPNQQWAIHAASRCFSTNAAIPFQPSPTVQETTSTSVTPGAVGLYNLFS